MNSILWYFFSNAGFVFSDKHPFWLISETVSVDQLLHQEDYFQIDIGFLILLHKSNFMYFSSATILINPEANFLTNKLLLKFWSKCYRKPDNKVHCLCLPERPITLIQKLSVAFPERLISLIQKLSNPYLTL